MFSIFVFIAILIPGIIPAFIDGIYGSGRGFRLVNSIVVALLITTFSYLTLAGIYSYNDIEFPLPVFAIKQQSIIDSLLMPIELNLFDYWREIAWASLIAIIYLIFWLPIIRNQWIEKLLQMLKLTDHSGSIDVWSGLFARSIKSKPFIQVSDNNHKRYYTGWVKAFSTFGNFRELLLLEVEIHDHEFNLIAQASTAYVGLPNDNVAVLFFSEERRIKK